MEESKYEEQLNSFINEFETTPLRNRTQEQRAKYNIAKKLLSLHSKGVSLTILHDAISKTNLDCWQEGRTLQENPIAVSANKKLRALINSYNSFLRSMPPLPYDDKVFKEHLMVTDVEHSWQALRIHFIQGHLLFSKFEETYRAAFGLGLKPSKKPARITNCRLEIYYELSKHMSRSMAKRETVKLINCAFPQLATGDEKKAVEALEKLINRHNS